nr:probable chitinase 10 [Leptinotarsa decemlineata]
MIINQYNFHYFSEGPTAKPTVPTPATTVTTPKTTTTTVNPRPDQDCPASGSKQIMYPADCSKYYQCENGKKELKDCPESLFFNFNTGLCDFIDQTNCQSPTAKPTVSSPATTVTTPKTTTTTTSSSPVSTTTHSPPTTIGIHLELHCFEITNCQRSTAKPTVPTPATTVTTPKTTTTTVIPHPDQDCPASGSKQIMYPADCSKYYQCENGIKELKDCPESLFFNINNGLFPTPATTVTTPETTTTTVNPHPDQDCPASGSKQIMYPADCSKYYQCENGIKELKDCPESLFFNINNGLCDFIDQTNCQGPTAKPTVPTPATSVTTPKTTTTTVNPHPDQDCPASGSKQIIYPGDCSKYYQCENGNKELKDCPESLFFNFNTGFCDFIDQTDCRELSLKFTNDIHYFSEGHTVKPTVSTSATTVTTSKTTTTTLNPNPDQDCPASGSKQIVYPGDCSKYYQCENGHKELKDCPESLFFNVNNGLCDFIDQTNCQGPTAKPTVPTPATTVSTPKTSKTTVNPHPDQDCPASGSKQIMYPADCSKYYQCTNGIKELKDCPESLFFNFNTGLCDFIDQTNCREYSIFIS